MKPREKAQELIDKFQWATLPDERTQPLDINYAKAYALIAVNEIISAMPMVYYWKEVKQELEKL